MADGYVKWFYPFLLIIIMRSKTSLTDYQTVKHGKQSSQKIRFNDVGVSLSCRNTA